MSVRRRTEEQRVAGLRGRGGEGGEARGGGRLVHTAPPCRPCMHTYSHTVQAADINNSLLIFICSGEMWGQSNPDTSRLSTCLSQCVAAYIQRWRSPSARLCIVHISHWADTFIQFAVIETAASVSASWGHPELQRLWDRWAKRLWG